MKIIHTGDWHLGQLFYEYDRTFEHQMFLDWLTNLIAEQQADVLLISGDVFDLSNPSALTVRMFYTFLNKAVRANPDIQIIVTAGNHDSPSRLESPKPLLELSNIHIVGMIEKDLNGHINFEKLVIPLKNKQQQTEILCLAIPFLRMGDYPVIAECSDPYAEGVAEMYKQVNKYAIAQLKSGQSVIAMGHLYAAGAERSGNDEHERPILGNIECVSASAFPADLKYVALGHIHKAQKIGGLNHIRYCGSPIPMSFSETNYTHQVICFDFNNGEVENLHPIEIPTAIPLLRVPNNHRPIHEVLSAINELPDADGDLNIAPYLEAKVLLDGPEPGLRHKIETALKGKHARLAKIDVKHPVLESGGVTTFITNKKLEEIKPIEIFTKVYEAKYNVPVPEILTSLFNQVFQEVSQGESK
ncbi:exodeoxyribonuclease I subunit D [Mucilaginibacter gracilis]|uniref:Nuclease SbcCD subunit D n=1 Tax=Mucilaginibacter gracilis TaxID=423350 RepID=A0A495J6U0_9SPHI|nr:exonuclease SbcCD subunit D C-terminal domain-containing protein [Mucilaginibacter gracilis]RKR84094.1 exodeoxyribonuclease I subunit D [Mucilaginibacter gracilis]